MKSGEVAPGWRGRRCETSFRVLLHTAVPGEIRRLPQSIGRRVKEIIDSLAQNPTPVGAIRLRGRVNAYRIRVRDYRIVYEVHATEIVVYVIGVAHRREVYQRILRRR